MKILIIFFLLISSAFAQVTRPNTPYWRLVDEIERTGLVAFKQHDWSQSSLYKLINQVPTLSNLRHQIARKNIQYKMGGENPGKDGFATVLKNGDIYIQVYYAKHKKNIDVALTLAHELIHAIHIDDGTFDYWFKSVKSHGKEYAQCQSEVGAYTWSGIYASDARTREWVQSQIQENLNCVKKYSR